MLEYRFMHFFSNKNDDPVLLIDAATWWIMTHKLDHFVKARVVREIVIAECDSK